MTKTLIKNPKFKLGEIVIFNNKSNREQWVQGEIFIASLLQVETNCWVYGVKFFNIEEKYIVFRKENEILKII